ncbi:hypothetical protein H0I23_10930 [Cellulophaga sp. HaHaR_3_176]|uniref:hypothetical protein n=1 Tax=Cellulophaga sp. HaHaR_3_176 TaxID=1942464 RepID=UPI001C1F2EDD|nr:hypothetical protein [Cellulophaga sp. HaHaR_3_176]QWX82975.1 hypothetical protein H0I23_10930 [Cellulophaga sp. HaHaR_3_176]
MKTTQAISMKKRAEFYIEDNKIEVFNSLMGKERVLLNGAKVSEKFGLLRSEHYFTFGGNNYDVRFERNLVFPNFKSFKIHKNSMPLNIENYMAKSSRNLLILIIILGLWLGFIIGMQLYKVIW